MVDLGDAHDRTAAGAASNLDGAVQFEEAQGLADGASRRPLLFHHDVFRVETGTGTQIALLDVAHDSAGDAGSGSLRARRLSSRRAVQRRADRAGSAQPKTGKRPTPRCKPLTSIFGVAVAVILAVVAIILVVRGNGDDKSGVPATTISDSTTTEPTDEEQQEDTTTTAAAPTTEEAVSTTGKTEAWSWGMKAGRPPSRACTCAGRRLDCCRSGRSRRC